MGKQNIRIALLALALVWPVVAGAADVTFAGSAESEYDDNVFRNATNEKDDVGFRLVPSVKLHEDRGHDFLYSLEYQAPLEFYTQYGSELDDVDHFAIGRATYHVSDRTELFARERFGYLRGQQRDVTITDLSGTYVNTERDRVTRNDAEVGIEHHFSPRLLGTARASHELFEIDRKDRADNWLLDASADLLYALTPNHQLGGGARYIRQEFDASTEVPGSDLNTVNLFAQWLWRIDETLDLSISAGPSWIDSDQDDARPVASVQTPTQLLTTTGIADVTGLGFVDVNGNPATGPYGPNTRVAPQIDACGQVIGGDRVAPCVLGPSNNTNVAGVLLDPGVPGDQAILGQMDTVTTLSAANTTRGDDSTSVDIYGQVVVRKRWTPNLQSALRYSRSQAAASGIGGAVVRDEVSLSNNWQITERWQAFARADWSLRQTINDANSVFTQAVGDQYGAGGVNFARYNQLIGVSGGANRVDTNRWGVAGRLTHLFTRNTSAWVQLTYNEQDSKGGTLGRGSDFTNFLGSVGIRHVFEPIKLW